MTGWLAPIVRALDERHEPLGIFIRDDDAGWEDERLFALLDLVAGHRLAIDLAVIPTAVEPALAVALRTRIAAGARIGLHQHGYCHANHEPQGRPCEFGPSRSAAAQTLDIERGQLVLRQQFGTAIDHIFTPPWNRCTAETTRALELAGLAALSRDRSALAMATNGLVECPIDVDWFAKSRGVRLDATEWAGLCAAAVRRAGRSLGLMLHHAVTTPEDLGRLDALLRLLAVHPLVRGVAMRDVVAHLRAERRMTCA
jgi:predicted deacetylase